MTDIIKTQFKTVLRRLKLGRLLDKLPECSVWYVRRC